MQNFRNRFIRPHLLIMLLFLFPRYGFSQSAEEAKNIFTRAEAYFIYEEYDLANQLYLLIETPDNMNIKYKIGICYLNISSEKEKSIPYLEAAVKSASYNSKTDSYKETKAPLDAYFYLAKAYMINNDFEKGLETLETFSKLVKETSAQGGMQNLEFIEQQIQACRNSILFRQAPLAFGRTTLGDSVTLGSINDNPAVSYDGKTLVYTERRGIINVIFFSKNEGDKWSAPIDITADLGAGEDCSSSSLNKDGTQLFLYKTDNYDGAIYSSNYLNGKWTTIKKLNKNINTKYYESHAAISYDGKKLYFTSNREGGFGNLDIYVSQKDGSGDWGPAVNLGPEINTPFNEDTPFITQNDSTLYFCSEGHNSMGGFDNYKSQLGPKGWKTPSNLGSPVNSPDDDKFFQPVNNGRYAYYSMSTGYKKKDIFFLDMGKKLEMSNYKIAGNVYLHDGKPIISNNFSIRIIDKVTGDTIHTGNPENTTGNYSINVAPGVFKVLFTGIGYYPVSIDTLIASESPVTELKLNATLYRDSTRVSVDGVKRVKIDLTNIPLITNIDTAKIIRNMTVTDVNDKTHDDSEILFYTVQVIALHKPVDVTYFKYIDDIKIMYNDDDKFYRYTTGRFQTKAEAYTLREQLIEKGYPDQIFVKKVTKSN